MPVLYDAHLPLVACALGALIATGCTLDNSVNDPDQATPPPNVFRDSPAAESVTEWQVPGDNLLQSLALIEDKDADSVPAPYNRILAVMYAELGAYRSAATNFEPFGPVLRRQEELCQSSVLPDAVDELCERLQDNPEDPEDQDLERLVFLSELQHVPAQTVLARKLLGCLKDAGFRYLALESLAEPAAALQARGYVSRTESGPLMREPQHARLVDEALQLGFEIVDYDVRDHCETCSYTDELRDHAEQQAANLVSRTLGVDPDAKVFVLAGPRQSYKEPWGQTPPFTTSLANRVWTQAQIEPYAIDQVEIDLPAPPFGASSPAPPSGMYMASGPNNGSCMGQYTPRTENGRGALDAVMVHVPPRSDSARWDWLHAPADERRSLTPNCAACSSGERLLVQAFPAGLELSDRIASDQALCVAGAECQMVLPPGSYQVVVWSEAARLGTAQVDLSTAVSAAISL
ncbi:MAG TPA: hypothetical protein VFS67_10325 [Polyangiaceae bacterium]|nr:hypothetical protein [Polyangiaceae bacterium]